MSWSSPLGRFGGLVGVDDVLVDAPGDLEGDTALIGQDLREAVLLVVGEAGARAGDPADAVDRVIEAAPVA